MAPRPAPQFWLSKSRLETLIDGIFAIAMTLLVLEIRVPVLSDPRSSAELRRALAQAWPTFSAYVLSFGALGAIWYRHHRQYRHLRRLDTVLFGVNLVFLLGATLFPFVAAVMGRYPGNPAAWAVYYPTLLGMTLCIVVQWEWARWKGHLDEGLDPADAAAVRHGNRKRVAGMAVLGLVLWLMSRGV